MLIKLIAAMAKNRTIGNKNTLPRDYPEDMKYFRTTTSGKTIIMGRKTYESIGRPLPNRRNIVLTSSPIEGVECYSNIPTLIEQLEKEGVEDCFVIGGATIYSAFLPFADQIYLTEIQKEYEGDTFFPLFEEGFQEISRNSQGELEFVVYERIK